MSWSWINIQDCRADMRVKVNKGSSEHFYGRVRAVKKPNKFVLYAFIDVYEKDGTVRDRWKPKVRTFQNTRYLEIEYDPDDWKLEQERIKQLKQAVRGARKVFAQKRVQAADSFSLLGISRSISLDDFRRVQREIGRKYHPDVVRNKIKNLSEVAAEELQKEAHLYNEAIINIQGFLARRK